MFIFRWLFGSKPTRVPHISTPKGNYPSEVKGESFCHDALFKIAGGYTEDGHDIETIATISAPADKPDALQVVIDGERVGWIPATRVEDVQAQMKRAGVKKFTCSANITGGYKLPRNKRCDFGVWLDIPKNGEIGF